MRCEALLGALREGWGGWGERGRGRGGWADGARGAMQRLEEDLGAEATARRREVGARLGVQGRDGMGEEGGMGWRWGYRGKGEAGACMWGTGSGGMGWERGGCGARRPWGGWRRTWGPRQPPGGASLVHGVGLGVWAWGTDRPGAPCNICDPNI